jgi:Spy/CpxP family protein refolding chaperone
VRNFSSVGGFKFRAPVPKFVVRAIGPKEKSLMSKFAALLVGVFIVCTAFAEDAPVAPGGTEATSSRPKHSGMRGDRAEQRLKRLSKKLNLTDEQKEKARPILQDEEKQLTAMESESSMTAQQKHKKTRDIRMASRSQLDGLLTDEQKTKLPQRRAGAGGHRHQRAGAPASGGSDQTPPQ